MFRLRQRPLQVSLKVFSESFEERRRQEAEKTIYKNDNIMITK